MVTHCFPGMEFPHQYTSPWLHMSCTGSAHLHSVVYLKKKKQKQKPKLNHINADSNILQKLYMKQDLLQLVIYPVLKAMQ